MGGGKKLSTARGTNPAPEEAKPEAKPNAIKHVSASQAYALFNMLVDESNVREVGPRDIISTWQQQIDGHTPPDSWRLGEAGTGPSQYLVDFLVHHVTLLQPLEKSVAKLKLREMQQ